MTALQNKPQTHLDKEDLIKSRVTLLEFCESSKEVGLNKYMFSINKSGLECG